MGSIGLRLPLHTGPDDRRRLVRRTAEARDRDRNHRRHTGEGDYAAGATVPAASHRLASVLHRPGPGLSCWPCAVDGSDHDAPAGRAEREGVFYSAEHVETAVAEMAFYRVLCFAESPETTIDGSFIAYSAFAVSVARCLDRRYCGNDRRFPARSGQLYRLPSFRGFCPSCAGRRNLDDAGSVSRKGCCPCVHQT
jgi:hypothetical protein